MHACNHDARTDVDHGVDDEKEPHRCQRDVPGALYIVEPVGKEKVITEHQDCADLDR